ncbi:MAG TPA: hypothetical protein ENK63_03330 [Rhodobacterales bacterium]|nr:hypothetical protein [Rhodobacterales bacterium]
MSLLNKLFGGAASKTPEPETYKDFRITAEPAKEAGGFRLAARIEKEIGGEVKIHQLIRADVFQAEDEARSFAISKAKQVIDQMGDGLFS